MCADLGGKDAVLRLVGHEDPSVQKQALLASQKVLLSKSKADYLTHLVRPPLIFSVLSMNTWILTRRKYADVCPSQPQMQMRLCAALWYCAVVPVVSATCHPVSSAKLNLSLPSAQISEFLEWLLQDGGVASANGR